MAEIIKCKGRFSGLNDKLNEALGITLSEGDKGVVDEKVLATAYDLVKPDIHSVDPRDPYFDSDGDCLRAKIDSRAPDSFIHTVPLISRDLTLDDALVARYAQSQGVINNNLLERLGLWHKGLNLSRMLKKREVSIKKLPPGVEKIELDDTKVKLDGYRLFSKFGIGKTKDDTVVPDTPYSIELRDSSGKPCLLVGFWYQLINNNEESMVIGQIQAPRDTTLPGHDQGSQIGIVGFALAKIVAKELGFDVIETYSARKHPMFQQHPDRKGRMMSQFTCIYDCSSKAFDGEGSRTTSYKIKP